MSTEVSFMDFKCPCCGQVVSFPSDAAGHLETCINCLRSILVPQPGTEVGGIIPLPITTPRLILRRFKTEDLEQLTSLLSEETFLGHMDGLADAEEESVLQWLGREQQVQLAAPDQTFHFAIQLQDGGGIIGSLGLRLMAD